MTLVGRGVRLLVGVTLAWWVGLAATAPEVPPAAALAGLVAFLAALWRPGAGLLVVAAVAPAGALLAAAPARAAELIAWAFLAGWLLRLWRPLTPGAQGATAPHPVIVPAALYGGALVASWLALTVGSAAGVPVASLPQFLVQSIPGDHLVFSSPEPQTWAALQSLTGIAMLVASVVLVRADPRLGRGVAWTLVASMTVLAAVTLADIARQWTDADFGGWFLLRYLRGERVSTHLRDLNAAGSLYVLAGLAAAAAAILDASRGWRWLLPLTLTLPALWLTGSRTSFLAVVGGLLLLALAQRRWPLARRQAAALATVLGVVLLAGAATMDWQPDVRGSAGRAANLRSQFLETTARMFAAAPVSGVGVGRYFDRSPEFMPPALRELYGNENAHNFFAQQFAELGLVGGLLFLWLAAAIVTAGWAAARAPSAGSVEPALVGLFAGVGAYLLTCLTGHPLLVPEAALPFWIAAGALAAAGHQAAVPWRHRRSAAAVTIVVVVVLAAGVARAAVSYAGVAAAPPEYGFHGLETAEDGAAFRWMTRHAVTYVPNGTGFVRVRLRAPDLPAPRPLVVEVAVAGAIVDRRELPPERWIAFDIPVRQAVSAPFRRVDLRANQMWTQETRLGRRAASRPIAAMVGGIQWIPLEEVK